jgi:mannose-1-phosphate guanylyltransferase
MKIIVMAGGYGTRLWPVSRYMHPKQFLSINSDSTLLQDTYERVSSFDISSITTVCNNEHRFFVAEQKRHIQAEAKIILEPIGKNTAPAIALAAFDSDPNDLLLVLSADHVMNEDEKFLKAVNSSKKIAEDGKIVTFGIKPSFPHIGYGYIKKGKGDLTSYVIEEFVEKPQLHEAENYVASKNYLWNSGIFLFKASVYLKELEKYRPDIHEICRKSIQNSKDDLDFKRIDEDLFKKCPSDSIDYAVMEKTDLGRVVEIDIEWSDVGSWSALWDVSEKDADGNNIFGDAITIDSKNCLIRSEDKLIATIGIKNLVVVSSKDAVLIANKDKTQDVKSLVEMLKDKNRNEWEIHREVYRPWGKYDSIDNGIDYQVKRITVKPGAKLSLQSHKHRSEHWVVVSGVAKVTKDNDTFLLNKNESTYIPVGTIHSLENPEDYDLELIEVQSGSYLGEDDIIRYEDVYGRVE